MRKTAKISSIIFLVLTSVTSWYFSYRSGLAIVYNDAMSHLNIARAVVDGKQPGLAQLGSVWLPLNHILALTLVWNDWAWHSGFAGSFFSMLAYICSAVGIYKIVQELTDDFWASLLGAAAFALNLNIIYLQTTPLTEPLYLVLFIFSVLFTIKFIKTNELRYLMLMGFFGMLQVLARYDGWFVVGIQGLVLIYQQFFVAKVKFQEVLGKFLIFSIPIIFGIALWLVWNALIFGSALYFMLGPYSAHAQQAVIQNSTGLITKGSWRISLLAYWYSVRDNIGNYTLLLAALGMVVFLGLKSKLGGIEKKTLILFVLFAPILFNIIALYLGFSILNLPELHWDPSGNPSQQWFNVRYGIMALPMAAVLIGLLAEKITKKIFLAVVLLVLLGQSFVMYQQGVITITDGTMGSSNASSYGDVANVLAQNVLANQNILISTFSYSSIIFKSGFPMRDFITEGDSSEWPEALATPQNYAQWVVMGNGNINDSIYNAIFKNNPKQFLTYYKTFYCDPKVCVYEKRTQAEMFVYADGANLKVGDTDFMVNGVNSYDLAYQPTSTIDATYKNLSSIGVNTVRFWMFGDGNADGFQPTSGVINEARFENADYAIADAAKYNIRLIPVLVNNWTDYGGEQQYLTWTGNNPANQDAFYTDPETIALFENYINHVIPRKNTVNGIPYSDDPTIMAWEIVNEPRWSADDSQAFVSWFSGVAAYIRQEDPNHMITVETDTTSVQKNGQFTIQDYCSILPVDLCTAHLYLYDNVTPVYNNMRTLQSNVQQYIATANADDKPFILGEVGISKTTSPFGEQPLDVLKNIVAFNKKSSGTLIWNWSQKPDTSYGFSPKGTNGQYTLADLSAVLGGIQPSTIYLAGNSTVAGGYDISTPGTGPVATSTPTAVTQAVASNNSDENSTPAAAPTTPMPEPLPEVPATIIAPTVSAPTVPTELSLPYDDGFIAADWIDGWGGTGVAKGVLTVGSNAQNTSGGIFLNGSSAWKNYLINADIDWVKGQTFTLIARRSDNNNYLECVFSYNENDSEHVDINRIQDNQTVSMAEEGTISNEADGIVKNNMDVAMQVSGDQVECGINKAFVVSNISIGLNPVLFTGGIGFTTWDPTPNNSQITVNNLWVTQVF